jgi:hypothetical protein
VCVCVCVCASGDGEMGIAWTAALGVVCAPSTHVFSRIRTHTRMQLERQDPSTGMIKAYFFTSYLSREDAFRLINACWAQSR